MSFLYFIFTFYMWKHLQRFSTRNNIAKNSLSSITLSIAAQYPLQNLLYSLTEQIILYFLVFLAWKKINKMKADGQTLKKCNNIGKVKRSRGQIARRKILILCWYTYIYIFTVGCRKCFYFSDPSEYWVQNVKNYF